MTAPLSINTVSVGPHQALRPGPVPVDRGLVHQRGIPHPQYGFRGVRRLWLSPPFHDPSGPPRGRTSLSGDRAFWRLVARAQRSSWRGSQVFRETGGEPCRDAPCGFDPRFGESRGPRVLPIHARILQALLRRIGPLRTGCRTIHERNPASGEDRASIPRSGACGFEADRNRHMHADPAAAGVRGHVRSRMRRTTRQPGSHKPPGGG